MALVVASTSTATSDGSAVLTLTKPTGVASGDLLLICASGNTLNLPTSSGFSTAISYTQDNGGSLPDTCGAILYKIADSSDEAASNYTVQNNYGSSKFYGAGAMLRVTGWSVGNPVYKSSTTGGTGDPVTTASASGLSLTRPSSSLLITLATFHSNNSPTSSATFSGYTRTATDSNPSWTEVLDTQIGDVAGLRETATSVAYANDTDTSAVSAWSISISSNTNGEADGYGAVFAVICEPRNDSGTTALHAVTPTEFAEAGVVVGTTGSNDLFEPDVALNTTSGIEDSRTVWTNGSKNSTTWTQGSK